ncbi:ABC transporter substrate-binding protein [Paenibacillus chondroitinus]|uniref:ABC transporter substrate-binding protein n=2 Tax=Paenibacillus TaxID=44249 RepID=A0ABU6DJE4_9BACL|nr:MULTISPECIES: ABC transporter substrate-binding protein [Paenibacillus]MCY9657909.1 ABC transporter substrate-binding protein [Paenibacillus anseongense]MEB4797876.1 ABC transporter substrate-binding protein [Paenibacillus chondroitinus]
MLAMKPWLSAGVTAMLFILSACGSTAAPTAAPTASTGAAASASPAAVTPASAAPAAAKTLVAKTTKGDVTIPAEPKRVVAAYYHGTLAALGMNPIGASKEWWMGSPFLKEQEAKMEDIGSPASVEKVASMNPDLIVINGFAEENYDKLSKIAPTVFIPYNAYKNVREEVKLLGDTFGRQKEAEQWLAKYEQKAKESREKIKGAVKEGETAVIINVREKKISFLGDNYGRGGEVIYNMLKLKAPDFVQKEAIDSGKQLVEFSMEMLSQYANVDHIFICMNEGTTEAQVKEILESPIWKTLPAVKNNKVHMLDYKTFLHYDPISILGQADLITDMLVKSAK